MAIASRGAVVLGGRGSISVQQLAWKRAARPALVRLLQGFAQAPQQLQASSAGDYESKVEIQLPRWYCYFHIIQYICDSAASAWCATSIWSGTRESGYCRISAAKNDNSQSAGSLNTSSLLFFVSSKSKSSRSLRTSFNKSLLLLLPI
ncbi:hypothetical protein SS50377_25984 [Spironucleus salmonicida]|uniref:Uncharacterized protein n=1 Tax=Spironucleus salmonicida TaxID=348837 RepID=V6LFC4_9EUKA|nr:hypothetical protein SS50377_25984 [Spironucleus salmonicida]|eukprot:EST43230.1 Hypothetical protein SS50377_17095 [Spironucleus salmonicida]